MSQRRPLQWIEVDYDFCSLSYGSSPCSAILGTTGQSKCFNTFFTCQDDENFDAGVKTLRFCESVAGIPPRENFFPVLRSVSKRTSSVNIGGTDDNLSAFGKRASLTANLTDFSYHDGVTDKYRDERRSGVAQSDSIGYEPKDFGTFFGRLLGRWPYYPGRDIRYCEGYIDGGVLQTVSTAHYILTDFKVEEGSNRVTIKARDPLDLANNNKALVPVPVNGVLLNDITASAGSLTLTPEGIGDDSYPASGRALIGSELVEFTRSGDVVTLTSRGVAGSEASSHSAEDNFQTSYSINQQRIDIVLADLLVTYAGLDASFIPTAKWAAEIDRWAVSTVLTTDIVKPENVDKIINEIAVLGLSIWWDEDLQEVGMKTVRPVDQDTVFDINDDVLKSIRFDDRNGDRLTEILFTSVLREPTADPDDSNSYSRGRYIVAVEEKSENAFNDTQFKEINCRLLNHGDEQTVRNSGNRILNRLKLTPRIYSMTLDASMRDIGLTDVLRVQSSLVQDATGRPVTTLMQVIEKENKTSGHDFIVYAQAYTFSNRFAFIAPNDVPDYLSATDAQRARYGFICADSGRFPDNTKPYVVI